MKPINSTTSLGQLLQTVPGCRPLFVQLGINPDLDQGRSLAAICHANDLEPQTVTRLLLALATTINPVPAVAARVMLLSELCDHLEQPQQACVYGELERLDLLTRMAARQERDGDRQLVAIRKAFVAFRTQLVAHLLTETEDLFPMIRLLADDDIPERPTRLALESRVARMEREHNDVDEALAELGRLIGNPSLKKQSPARAQAMAVAVVRLEHAVHEQIYHENQVLFPRALACECFA